MKMIARIAVLVGPALLAQGCDSTASYSKDVKPFVDKYCIRCHKPGAEGTEKSGFMMETYKDLMKGTQYGAVVKPGDSFTSALVMLVEGRAHPSLRMPHDKGEKPTQGEIDKVKAWIEQGAKEN
jgi:uncharacterized membrane protein